MWFKRKIERKVVLVRKIHGSYHIQHVFKLKKIDIKTITFKGNDYLFDYKIPSYISGLKVFYFIDMDDNCQLTFDSVKQIDSKVLNLLLSDQLIRSLSDSLKTERGLGVEMKSFLMGIFMGVFGALCVVFILISSGVF